MPQQSNLNAIYTYDICAVIIVGLILFSLYFKKLHHGAINKSFIVLCFVVLLTTLADLLGLYYSKPETIQTITPFWFYAFQSSYFILRCLNIPVYAVYIIICAEGWESLKKKSFLSKILFLLPSMLIISCLLINPAKPFMFEHDPVIGYHRLPGMLLMYVHAVIYMVFCLIIIMKYRHLFSRVVRISLISMFPLQIAAILIQIYNSNLVIEMFATSCAILMFTVTIQRPELLINWELGTNTKHMYFSDLKRLTSLKTPATILFINIKNYKDIKNYLPREKLIIVLKNIYAETLEHAPHDFRNAEGYYLDNGLFAILNAQVSKQSAKKYADILYVLYSQPAVLDKLEIHLVPQIGYYDYPDDIGEYHELISFIQSFSSLMPPNAKTPVDIARLTSTKNFRLRNEIDSIVADAIVKEKFQMYYQPIWSVTKKKFISAEALIRLPDEKYGFVSPEIFIPAAERSGAIYQIGDFIIDDVCRFIAREAFRKSGLEYIEINLAVAQCLQPDLPEKIRACVEKYSIDFSQLNLEITERETIADQALFDRNIQKLADMGMMLSLDDYGTGYSNIQRITAMPLDIVKIDKSFVDKKDEQSMQTIIKKTITMMKDLNKEIVIEGIEDESSVDFFTNLDCDFIQGFYFSKPLPEDAFIEFCLSRNVQ